MHTYKDEALHYQKVRSSFWENIANSFPKSWSSYYHNRLIASYRNFIPEGARILELGCSRGDLLAALKPSNGVGVDFCSKALEYGRLVHPHLEFILSDVHDLNLGQRTFDYIIVSELVNDLWDVQTVLEQLRPYCASHTRLIFNFYSHLWNVPLSLGRKLGLATPNLRQNWLTQHDMENLLEISGFQSLRKCEEVIVPVWVPFLSNFANRYESTPKH